MFCQVVAGVSFICLCRTVSKPAVSSSPVHLWRVLVESVVKCQVMTHQDHYYSCKVPMS